MAEVRNLGETLRIDRRPVRVLDGDVLQYRPQITQYLRQQSMRTHADLLAGVNPLADRLQWLTELPGDIVPFAALPAERSQAMMAQITRLVGDIRRESERLSADGNPNQRGMGDLLAAALEGTGPETLRLSDVFVVGEQPVLAWGVREVSEGVAAQDLLATYVAPRGGGKTPIPGAPEPALSRPAGTQAAQMASPPILIRRRVVFELWPVRLLALAALVLLLAAILAWYMPGIATAALALRLPPAPQCGQPAQNARLIELQVEEAQLRAEIAAAQRNLDGQVLECRIAAVPPAAEPVPQPPPTPPAAPDASMDQRLQREHAQSTSTQVTLSWDGRKDLDLLVQCPDKRVISLRGRACGGELDVDMNFATHSSDTPVENVIWPNGAPAGHYRVEIHNYTATHALQTGDPSQQEAVPFRVRITVNGQQHEVTGSVGAQPVIITEFDVP